MVVHDEAMKQFVREHCEEVEQKTHSGAAPWFRAFLDDTGLTPEKRFLTEAPVLVLVFGERGAPYWRESSGLSSGITGGLGLGRISIGYMADSSGSR